MDWEQRVKALGESLLAASLGSMKRPRIRAMLESAGEVEDLAAMLAHLAEMLAKDPEKFEVLCDEYHAISFPPARLPWIPIVESKSSLTNTVYYQLWESSAEAKCRSLQLQRTIASTIPYYLPKRYHSMDCLSLLKSSSGDKCLHFANATQLFTFSQVYSLQYWLFVNHIYGELKSHFKATVFLLTTTFHSPNTQERIFPDEEDLHQCETAEEFLLEPWLLMQIPWHPAIYNQWLAAALAEVLKAKKELVEFYRWPVPEKLFFAVTLLLSKVETLHRRLLHGANLINWLSHMSGGFNVNLFTAHFLLDHVILPSLPVIEFLVSKKFSHVTQALKRMAWLCGGDTTEEEEFVANCRSTSINDFETIYGLRYFERDNAEDMFGFKKVFVKDILMKFDGLQSEVDFIPIGRCYDKIRANKNPADDVLWENKTEEIKLLTQKIVSERVKGQVAFPESMWQRNSHFFARSYRRSFNNADFEKGVQRNDVSVIYNLHSLQAKLEVADEQAVCSGFVFLELRKEGKNVDLQLPNFSGPEMSLNVVEQLLTKVFSKEWTLETLKEKIPAECKVDIDYEESCPGAEVGYQDTIKMFEMRIKKLVYHIFDVSSTEGFEKEFIFPEWQFIQYILPCFVTQFGHLATNSKTKPNELHIYTRFVHNLIRSFELNLKKTNLIQGSCEDLKPFIDLDLPHWMCKNQVNNVMSQLQAVEDELGILVHGTHKKIKKAGSADFPLGQICFRILSDTLKNNTLNQTRPLMLKCWTEILLNFIPRLKGAILTELMASSNPFPTNNLFQAVAVLDELKNTVVTYNLKPVDELSLMCLEKADHKLKMSLGKQPVAIRGKFDKKLNLEMQMLTVQQLLGVALFGIVNGWKNRDKGMLKVFDPTKILHTATITLAVKNFVRKDWQGLLSVLSPLLCDKDGNDLSLVTMEFAKKSASSCYIRVHEAFKMRDLKKKHFLSLHPIIPIMFCRCCVDFEVKLKKCKICVDNSDFPDVHWFCSEKCEEKVLAERHLEEHDHNLMVKCGLV